MPTKKNRDKSSRAAQLAKARQLRELSAAEFENLIFDVIASRGAQAVTWRTPGADGGRDIECLVVHQDFSGAYVTQRWFVECKRYSRSVDWPTIYEKLSYAVSRDADVLLMCTSATFSVNATTEVEKWNADGRRPRIRLWPRHEIERQLVEYPDLRLKYGLSHSRSMPGKSMVTLALALSKAVSSHYSRLIFREEKTDRMLEAAQALSDMLLRRMDEIERYGQVSVPPSFKLSDSLRQFMVEDRLVTIDEYGLCAFVTYLASLTADKITLKATTESQCHVFSAGAIDSLMQRYLHVFSAIAIWSNFDFKVSEKSVQIDQRTGI